MLHYIDMEKAPLKNKFMDISLFSIGYILSPLSWWNDAWVNFPLAYLISIPMVKAGISSQTEAFFISYLITNIVGLLLMIRISLIIRFFRSLKKLNKYIKRD